MKKILFIAPPYHCWGVQVIGTWPPLQLAYLAGVAVKAGFEAKIFDAMNKYVTFDEVRAEIQRYRPDCVVSLDYLPVSGAISTATVPAALEALAIAKEVDPSITTLIGGPHPTFMYQEILTAERLPPDFVLRGENEATFAEMLRLWSDTERLAINWREVKGLAFIDDGEVVNTRLRPHIENLDDYQPAWHLLDWEDYHYNIEPWGRMASIMTTRGCMMDCSFCSHRVFWRGDWRVRSPELVIEEIRHLVDTYQVEFITLIDPYPTKDRERWEHQLDLLIEAQIPVRLLMETRVEDIIRDADILHKYRDAGIIHMYLGAESSDDTTLNSLNKGTSVDMNKEAIDLLREVDIMTEASFMIGFPEDTPESVSATIDEAIRLNPDIAVFPLITPMPFTPLYKQMKSRIRVHDWSKYNLMTPIIEPDNMSLDQVHRELARCYMTFYGNKMKEVLELPDGFKRRYMLSAFKAMMKDFHNHFDFGDHPVPHDMAGLRELKDAIDY
ncbi:B12-binding domain-containing radical SAM protein [Motiliproteus sp. SC1-56]|uniref:B12-binding domain-containing radical SAM protein n=1 Tax=Motiliproteus sp. SC1-56 TaxID=2799565 RepID=UPI001A8E9A9D|nr:radical SAM protein [Motiliproteus sp. SC1-56]